MDSNIQYKLYNEWVESNSKISMAEFCYNKGREDERMDWECAAGDSLMKYAGDIYVALPNIVKQIRKDAIDEYSNNLFSVIEQCTVNCKFDFSIDDLHNLEVVIKGLAEEMKGDLK